MEKKTSEELRKNLLGQEDNDDFRGCMDRMQHIDIGVVLEKRKDTNVAKRIYPSS